jgi:hypothetical protein
MMEVPFVYERIVIADRSATEGAIVEGQPIYSPAFDLEGGSSHWWEPVRTTLATHLGQHEIKPNARKVITYIHTQAESQGANLSDEDHKSISLALDKMTRTYGYEVHIVSTQTSQTDWVTKMTAIVKSSVRLCFHYDDDLFIQLFIDYPERVWEPSNGQYFHATFASINRDRNFPCEQVLPGSRTCDTSTRSSIYGLVGESVSCLFLLTF